MLNWFVVCSNFLFASCYISVNDRKGPPTGTWPTVLRSWNICLSHIRSETTHPACRAQLQKELLCSNISPLCPHNYTLNIALIKNISSRRYMVAPLFVSFLLIAHLAARLNWFPGTLIDCVARGRFVLEGEPSWLSASLNRDRESVWDVVKGEENDMSATQVIKTVRKQWLITRFSFKLSAVNIQTFRVDLCGSI